MMGWVVLGIVLWVFVSFAPAFIARSKGRSFLLYWLISLFFWWITLFITIFMKPIPPASAAAGSTAVPQ